MATPEIITALTTPFTRVGDVDLSAFRRELERLRPYVDAVFVAGTTGEFLALEASEHSQLVSESLDVFGPDRVVVHVGSASLKQSLGLTRSARTLGAKRFAALTPFYIAANVETVLDFWSTINDECGGELYGYVYPDVAVTDVAPRDLGRISESGIVGLKVSGAASTRISEYLAAAPEGFRVWTGNDANIPEAMKKGARGSVSGVSGVVPTLWAALRDSMEAENKEEADRIQLEIQEVVSLLGPSIRNLKYALSLLGLSEECCRMPIDKLDQTMIGKIRSLTVLDEER